MVVVGGSIVPAFGACSKATSVGSLHRALRNSLRGGIGGLVQQLALHFLVLAKGANVTRFALQRFHRFVEFRSTQGLASIAALGLDSRRRIGAPLDRRHAKAQPEQHFLPLDRIELETLFLNFFALRRSRLFIVFYGVVAFVQVIPANRYGNALHDARVFPNDDGVFTDSHFAKAYL